MIRFDQYLVFHDEEDFDRNVTQQDDRYIVDYHILEHKPKQFPAFLKRHFLDSHSVGWLIKCDPEQILDAIKKEISVLNNLKTEIKRLMGE